MAIREVWIGTYGPFLYNDEEPYAEEPGTTQKALRGANLNDLEDFEVESPLDDHALVYDDADGKFKNKYITSSRIKDVPADRMLGRLSTAGAVQELTSAEVRGFLDIEPGYGNVSIDDTDSPYSATVLAHTSVILVDAASADVDISLPAASDATDKMVVVKRTDTVTSNAVNVNPDGTDEIDESNTAYVLSGEYDTVALFSNGSAWWVISRYT